MSFGKSLAVLFLSFFLTISVSAQCDCTPTPNTGAVVTVTSVAELNAAMSQANSQNGDLTILVEPGNYVLNSNLLFISQNMENLMIKGSTGNRDDVVIVGQGWNDASVTHVFNVAADNFTVADMTIGEVYYHAVQVHSNPNDADHFTMRNVRVIDVKEQMVKVSGGGSLLADNGLIECSSFEFTNGIAYQWYTGGIDAHRSKDWVIRNNYFEGIISPESNLAEHAIHMWRESEGTLVEGNRIVDCDRGIGFGLGSAADHGHTGGIIINNFVHTSTDVGIGLEASPNAKVYNNTVITDNYPRSIEYRFPLTSNAQIANNLVNGEISDRQSGSSGTLTTNYTLSDLGMFIDATNHDYHLSGFSAGISDSGTEFPETQNDIDCESRPVGAGIDIGADEWMADPCTVELEIYALLEGAYHETGSMFSFLDAQIPFNQPYNLSPYNYSGNESLPSIPANMVDWVLIEIRSGTPSSLAERTTVTLETKAGILLIDGSVVSTDGTPISFEMLSAGEEYYICLRHRNHLDVLSASPIVAEPGMLYNFASGLAYGEEQLKSSGDGYMLLHAGDFNQDGVIQSDDYDVWKISPAELDVYEEADANLDGTIQTTDIDEWFVNKAKIGSVEIDY